MQNGADFAVESFVNVNNCFENNFKKDHAYAKKSYNTCFSEDNFLTEERTECVEVVAQPPFLL